MKFSKLVTSFIQEYLIAYCFHGRFTVDSPYACVVHKPFEYQTPYDIQVLLGKHGSDSVQNHRGRE